MQFRPPRILTQVYFTHKVREMKFQEKNDFDINSIDYKPLLIFFI